MSALPLPGFERLIARCREYQLPLLLAPPVERPPQAGEVFLGFPLDPQLAAVFERVSEAEIGDIFLHRPDAGEYGMARTNEMLRADGREPFRSSLVFGRVPSLAYRFALVPGLADAHGVQPVIFIDDHIDKEVLPAASSLDRFFETYARCIEEFAASRDADSRDWSDIDFPRPEPELVAEDRALVEMLRAGRFDALVTHDAESQQWLQAVLDARPRLQR